MPSATKMSHQNRTSPNRLSVLQLFYVGYVAQSRQSALLLALHKWFSYKGNECRLALSSEPQK